MLAKANHSIHPNNVDLGNEVYRLLKLKHDTISKSVKDEREEIRKELSLFQAIVDLGLNLLIVCSCTREILENLMNNLAMQKNTLKKRKN